MAALAGSRETALIIQCRKKFKNVQLQPFGVGVSVKGNIKLLLRANMVPQKKKKKTVTARSVLMNQPFC